MITDILDLMVNSHRFPFKPNQEFILDHWINLINLLENFHHPFQRLPKLLKG